MAYRLGAAGTAAVSVPKTNSDRNLSLTPVGRNRQPQTLWDALVGLGIDLEFRCGAVTPPPLRICWEPPPGSSGRNVSQVEQEHAYSFTPALWHCEQVGLFGLRCLLRALAPAFCAWEGQLAFDLKHTQHRVGAADQEPLTWNVPSFLLRSAATCPRFAWALPLTYIAACLRWQGCLTFLFSCILLEQVPGAYGYLLCRHTSFWTPPIGSGTPPNIAPF